MKLWPFVLLLFIESLLHCTADDTRAIKPGSTEMFFEKLKKLVIPDLQIDAVEKFMEDKLKKKDEEKAKEVAEALKEQEMKLTEESELDVFASSSCIIRDDVESVFKGFVNPHSKMVVTSTIHAPPEVIKGQVYNQSEEKFMFLNYPKWLSFTYTCKSQLAECFRDKLNKTKYSTEQFSWSAPKLYKFYNRYHHRSDSPTMITFDKYFSIRAAVEESSVSDPINADISQIPLITNQAELNLFLELTLSKKTFLDILEEKNQWYITNEDCHIINIIRVCLGGKKPFHCRPFKKKPKPRCTST